MSETTSAPAEAPPESSPPAASQEPISVSDAARLLSRQRRQGGGEGETAAPAERKPSPNEAIAAAQKPAEATAADAAPKKADTGLSAMERALGVPGVAPPEGAPPAADAAATIEVEGQRYTQAQLREAVLKAGDYTQKTQELAQQRQALQAQQEALASVLPYIQPELQRLAETVQNAPQRPDPGLLETDPQRYLRERAVYEQAVEEQNRLGSLTHLQQQAHARAMEQAVNAANEQLAKELPFWADPQERLQAQQQIVEWATSKGGFSRDELRGLTSPHHLKAMMKAAMFDRWVESAKTSAPSTGLAAPVRGAPPPPPPAERIQVAEQRFDERPNIRTAAALLGARRGVNGQAR